MILAGTGHRPDKLGGYSSKVFSRLTDLASAALIKLSPNVVISGMALGWDQALARAAIQNKIKLIAYIPFEGQESAWPKESQEEYMWIRERADEVKVVCSGGYSPQKMQIRNKAMVDDCDLLLALWDGTAGGTGNCISYAEQAGREIFNLWPSWLKYSGV